MFAILAAIAFFLHAVGIEAGALSLVWLGVALLALHLAYDPLPRFLGPRNRNNR